MGGGRIETTQRTRRVCLDSRGEGLEVRSGEYSNLGTPRRILLGVYTLGPAFSETSANEEGRLNVIESAGGGSGRARPSAREVAGNVGSRGRENDNS